MNSENQGNVALKAGVWYVISTVMVRAMTVISTPIFTRLMTIEEYGMVSAFTTWYSLLLPVFTLNLNYSIGRAKLDYPYKLDDYIGSMQLLSAIISVVLMVIILIFIRPISQLTSLSYGLIVLLLVYLFFMPAINFAQDGYRYQYKYRQNIAIAWYSILTNIGCSLILVLLVSGDKAILRCIGIVIPIVLLSIFFWARGFHGEHIKINKEYWKYGVTLSIPLILHTISLHILSASDRIFITSICGATDTGIYTLAYQIGLILSVISNAIGDSWLPWFHDNYHAGNFSSIRENSKLIVILGCYIALACIALAPEGILILGGESYMAGVYCVMPIVLGVTCQFIYTHYVNIEMHLKKTVYVSIGTVVAAVLNIVLNMIFIPRFGFVAAAYTTLFSYFALLVIHFLITKLVLHVNLYDDIFMFGAMIVVSIIGIILVLTYEFTIVRYLLIIIGFISFIFVFRDYIIGYIKRIIHKNKD